MGAKMNGQIRAVLAGIGGILAAFGYLSDTEAATLVDDAMMAIGAAGIVVTNVWSYAEKAKRGHE